MPIENIEVIQNITANKENLYGIDLKNLFKEYENKNLALVLIQDTNSDKDKIFLVFSDDIDWCKKHFQDEKFVLINYNSDYIDLYLIF